MCYVELTIRDLEQETKVDEVLADENLVMPKDELPETKTEEKTKETAPAPEEVKATKKAEKKTTTKKEESEESETKAVAPKKPVKKKKAEKKEEKKSWWSRFFK